LQPLQRLGLCQRLRLCAQRCTLLARYLRHVLLTRGWQRLLCC
jgi:hypothetical protein